MKSFRSVRLGKRPYRQERRVRTNGPESIHSSVPFWKTPGKTCLPTIAGASGQRAGASGRRGGNSGRRGGNSWRRGGASGHRKPHSLPIQKPKAKESRRFSPPASGYCNNSDSMLSGFLRFSCKNTDSLHSNRHSFRFLTTPFPTSQLRCHFLL